MSLYLTPPFICVEYMTPKTMITRLSMVALARRARIPIRLGSFWEAAKAE